MSRAQGQFTIIDYNDALTLTGYIGSNHPKTQMYNPDNGSYIPDWASSNMVLTPQLFVAGSGTDVITDAAVQSVKWYEDSAAAAITAGASYALSGAKSHILTIKANVLAGLAGRDYRCVVVYRDPTTALDLTYTMSISLSRVVNGGGITDLIVTTPAGNVFKNGSVGSLTAKAELWRGSTVDTTNVSYQWYKQDASITADQGGGTGWRKLSNAANQFAGVTAATLTVYASQVDSYATFKCVAKDTDSASATYNKSFADTASFVDLSDPYQVIISSTGGDVFKNGEGSTTLTARVFQAGAELDSGGALSYVWTKYGADGTVDSAWGTGGTKTGKTLSVGGADVSVKATFMVEVTL